MWVEQKKGCMYVGEDVQCAIGLLADQLTIKFKSRSRLTRSRELSLPAKLKAARSTSTSCGVIPLSSCSEVRTAVACVLILANDCPFGSAGFLFSEAFHPACTKTEIFWEDVLIKRIASVRLSSGDCFAAAFCLPFGSARVSLVASLWVRSSTSFVRVFGGRRDPEAVGIFVQGQDASPVSCHVIRVQLVSAQNMVSFEFRDEFQSLREDAANYEFANEQNIAAMDERTATALLESELSPVCHSPSNLISSRRRKSRRLFR